MKVVIKKTERMLRREQKKHEKEAKKEARKNNRNIKIDYHRQRLCVTKPKMTISIRFFGIILSVLFLFLYFKSPDFLNLSMGNISLIVFSFLALVGFVCAIALNKYSLLHKTIIKKSYVIVTILFYGSNILLWSTIILYDFNKYNFSITDHLVYIILFTFIIILIIIIKKVLNEIQRCCRLYSLTKKDFN